MEPQSQSLNIVVRGQFTPTIYQPAWFAQQGLIRAAEVSAAKIDFLFPQQHVSFRAGWLRLNAQQDRLQALTDEIAYYEILRDLVVGIISVADDLKLNFLGINRDFHYQMDSEAAWHAIGNSLAPETAWSGLLNSPGMISVTVQGARESEIPGYINVKVQPSAIVSPNGVFVNTNDHYDLRGIPDTEKAAKAIELLGEGWSEAMERSCAIADGIARAGRQT